MTSRFYEHGHHLRRLDSPMEHEWRNAALFVLGLEDKRVGMERIPGEPVNDDAWEFCAASVDDPRIIILLAPVDGIWLTVDRIDDSAAIVLAQLLERVGLIVPVDVDAEHLRLGSVAIAAIGYGEHKFSRTLVINVG